MGPEECHFHHFQSSSLFVPYSLESFRRGYRSLTYNYLMIKFYCCAVTSNRILNELVNIAFLRLHSVIETVDSCYYFTIWPLESQDETTIDNKQLKLCVMTTPRTSLVYLPTPASVIMILQHRKSESSVVCLCESEVAGTLQWVITTTSLSWLNELSKI